MSQLTLLPSDEGDAPQQFVFNGAHTIRVIDRDGEPWFVASDVCKAIDLDNVSRALDRLEDDEKDDVTLSDVIGRRQRIAIINEPGMYSLILRSDKPEAKAFRRWVTHEVIPAIRKHGGYLMRNLSPAEMLVVMAQRLVDQERALAAHEQRLSDIEHRQTAIEKGSQHFAVIAYANKIGRRIDHAKAQSIGRYATRYSRKHGYTIGESPHPLYGKVNTYHEDVLRAVFGLPDED